MTKDAKIAALEADVAGLRAQMAEIDRFMCKVNAVTAPHRHGNTVSKHRLDELSDGQLEVESAMSSAPKVLGAVNVGVISHYSAQALSSGVGAVVVHQHGIPGPECVPVRVIVTEREREGE